LELTDPAVAFGKKSVAPVLPPQKPITTKLTNPADVLKKPQAFGGLTKEDVLATPEDMSALRDMMVASKDTYYQTAPDEEVYDDFMSHMRWMNTNEVYTAKEAIDVYAADDKTKAAYGKAYEVYDKVGSIFANGGDAGDKAGAMGDYAKAIFFAPSTWAGFLVGRAASSIATKSSVQAIKESVVVAGKEAAKKGASKTAQRQVKREVALAAVKVNAKIATASALAIEAPLAFAQDALYQDVMMETGAQEEFSYMQSAMSTILGGAGAATSWLSASTFKGATGLADADVKIKAGLKERAKKSRKRVAEDVKAAIKAVNTDWIKLVEEGRGLQENQALRDAVVNWFTDYKTDNGFISILQRNGAELNVETAGGFAKSLASFARGLDDDMRAGINEAFRPLGITFDQVVNTFASTVNEAGYQNQALSSASKFWDNYKGITVSNRKAAEGVVASAADDVEVLPQDAQTLGYIQSVWKRMLVSHPGTTTLNVKGWLFSMSGRTLAEAVQMSALYGAGGVKALMGSTTANVTLGQASALMKNMAYMTKMAVDPFTTVEGFYKLLENAPKKIQREVAQQFFQGVDNRGAAAFGLNEKSFAVRNTERLTEMAQRISFVNAQDVLTKSFSGIKELDKQSRLAHGIGIDDLLNDGRAHEITDEMWQKAVNALQEDTFSVDFRGSKSPLGKLARISQEVSTIPGIGFFYPFGQFVNSIMAFSVRYSPIGFIPLAGKLKKAGLKSFDMDMGTRTAQAIVGTTAIAMAAHREREKQAQGLQWNEERDETGSVYKVDNMFPWGLYNLAGRIWNHWSDGEGMNKDLMVAAAQQLSFPAAIAEAGNPQPIGDLVKYMTDETNPEDDRNAFFDLIGYAVESVSGIAAGFTRPLDPINKIVGELEDVQGRTSNVSIDRKQAEGVDVTIQNLTRYTNTLFNFLLGEEQEDGRLLYGEPKYSATQKGPVRNANTGASVFGAQYVQRRTPIDILLGMVDKAPFKADSFTSGNPEYDSFMNQSVNPILERRAVDMLNNPRFKALSLGQKIARVEEMLAAAREEVLDALEGGTVGGTNEVLLRERMKLLTKSRPDIISAKKELGITTPNNKLNLTQINLINQHLKVMKEIFKDEFDF